MPGQIITIARNTFLESVRQPIYFVLLMAGWILQALNMLMSAYSLGYTDSSEVTGDNKLLLDIGLATVFVLSTLLAAFLATAVLSREIENKTALTVIAKPVGRPTFILGKYLGVTGAILVATVILLVFFEMALRHRVMTSASDKVDLPVVVFTGLALLISVGLGVWGNYFYGWVFSSTAVLALLPLSLLAWLAVLLVSKNWHLQDVTAARLMPQIKLAGAALGLAMPVLCAVAIAASTRLGQVMTISLCAGAFVLGLLSNHLIGRHAFVNERVAVIKAAAPERDSDADLQDAGDSWAITFQQPSSRLLKAGDSFYYGPSPQGVGQVLPPFPKFDGDPNKDNNLYDEARQGVVILSSDLSAGTVVVGNAGNFRTPRPPREGDYVFLTPTRINPIAVGLWSIVPNMQLYWLVDAITQSHPIPPRYVGLVALYTLAQVTGLLALAIILFQRREVG